MRIPAGAVLLVQGTTWNTVPDITVSYRMLSKDGRLVEGERRLVGAGTGISTFVDLIEGTLVSVLVFISSASSSVVGEVCASVAVLDGKTSAARTLGVLVNGIVGYQWRGALSWRQDMESQSFGVPRLSGFYNNTALTAGQELSIEVGEVWSTPGPKAVALAFTASAAVATRTVTLELGLLNGPVIRIPGSGNVTAGQTATYWWHRGSLPTGATALNYHQILPEFDDRGGMTISTVTTNLQAGDQISLVRIQWDDVQMGAVNFP